MRPGAVGGHVGGPLIQTRATYSPAPVPGRPLPAPLFSSPFPPFPLFGPLSVLSFFVLAPRHVPWEGGCWLLKKSSSLSIKLNMPQRHPRFICVPYFRPPIHASKPQFNVQPSRIFENLKSSIYIDPKWGCQCNAGHTVPQIIRPGGSAFGGARAYDKLGNKNRIYPTLPAVVHLEECRAVRPVLGYYSWTS